MAGFKTAKVIRFEDELEKTLKRFFEPRLVSLELSVEQIKEQSIEQLRLSLERVNEAIKNPASFGVLRLKVSGQDGLLIVAKSLPEAQFEQGILPILLERKKLILDRIRSLGATENIENLRDLVEQITDEDIRAKLRREIEDLENQSREFDRQKQDVEQAALQQQKETEEKLDKLRIFEGKVKMWRSLLERESAATIIGGLLLVVIVFAQIIAMFSTRVSSSDIIDNGFLLILGYFFGQTVSRSSAKPGE